MRTSGRFHLIKPDGERLSAGNSLTAVGRSLFSLAGPFNIGLGVLSPQIEDHLPCTFDSATTTRLGVPDDDAVLWWQVRYKAAYVPVAGRPVATLTHGAAYVSGGVYIAAMMAQSQLLGAAGTAGSPVVDTAVEPFDLVWEFTEYVPAERRSTVTLTRSVSGVVTTSVHEVIVRPANFLNVTDSDKGWKAIESAVFVNAVFDLAKIRIGIGTISIYSGAPTFDESWAAEEFVSSTMLATWGFDAVGDFDCAHVFLGHTEWQLSFDPPIHKTADDRLRIDFSLLIS